jgi:uncharacterized protein
MSKRNRIFLTVGILVVLLGTVAYLGAGAYVYGIISAVQYACGCCPDDLQNTPTNFTVTLANPQDGEVMRTARARINAADYFVPSFESVKFPSRDPKTNVVIDAWYVPSDDPVNNPTIILVHGLNSCKNSEHILMVNGMLHRAGYNTLMIDLRNMGASTQVDGRFSAGVKEHLDILGAFDWLVQFKKVRPEQIGVVGFSLGAASSLIALGEEQGIAALWEDSSFADLQDVVYVELGRYGVPGFVYNSTVFMARMIADVDITQYSPLDAVTQLNGRALYITHGTGDTRLKSNYAQQLYDTASQHSDNVELWLVDDLNHTEALLVYPAEYGERLVSFFNRAFGRE